LSEAVTEVPPPAKKRTKSKARVAKRKPKVADTPDAPLSVHEQEQEPSNPSPHTKTKSTLPLKAQFIRHSDEDKKDNRLAENTLERESHHDAVATHVEEQPGQPPKKKKVVRRVRVPKVSTKRANPTADNRSVDVVDTDVPQVPDDIHPSLFEAVAPAPTTEKASKAFKRIFFNDDSDVDLDQMLSGIAAMAETKTTTKVATSKSRRVTRKNVAS